MHVKSPKLCYLWLEFVEDSASGAVSHMRGFLSGWKKLGEFFIVTGKKFGYLSDFKNVKPVGLKSRAGLLVANFFGYARIRKAVSEETPDVMYCRHAFFTDIGARLARDLKIPLFLEFNGSVVWMTKQWIKNPAKKALVSLITPVLRHYEMSSLNGATKIFVVSNAMKDAVLSLGIPEEKIVVNPNGVDPKQFNPKISGENVRKKYSVPKNAVVIGFIGSFGKWHGAEVLAKAAKEIAKERKDIYFLFMGNGQYRKDAENEAGKNENIIFTGPVPRDAVPEHLAACDILVNPTVPNPDDTEFFGSPTKLFEYMAMGKAIISSSLGQMKEILENNKDAILVEAGSPNAINDAILALVRDNKLRETLGKNAMDKVVKEYTWERNATRVLKTYNFLH